MSKFFIRKASYKDVDAVEKIYSRIHDEEECGNNITGWVRNVYPVRNVAEKAVERDDLYILEADGEIVGSAIVNNIQGDDYSKGKWVYEAMDNEVCVLHTLVISPDVSGRGYGKAFVKFYENIAKENGCIELRMDTNEKNVAARSLYKKLGFKEIGILPVIFNGIPDISMVLLEKHI